MGIDCSDVLCGDVENVDDIFSPGWNSVDTKKDQQDEEEEQTENVFNSLLSMLSIGSDNKNITNKEEILSDTESEDADADSSNIRAMVFMISGCEDSQTSADVSNVSGFSLPNPNGRAGGACTSALLKVLYANHSAITNLTFVQVLSQMRNILRQESFSQIPQLTSSKPLDVSQTFYIVPPNCQGTRRAVLIGINYTGQNGELSGCQNDCLNMKDYIMNVWGFQEENITVLMDDGDHTNPTRLNMLSAYKAVAAASMSGDAVFCHYSGHGGRLRDDDWDEEKDGYDETLIPVDYASAGQIRDDDLYKRLVCAVPEGVHLVSLMDCCHSGTVLDLPYSYRADGTSEEQEMSFDPNKLEQTGACGNGCNYTTLCICTGIIVIVVLAIVLPITLS